MQISHNFFPNFSAIKRAPLNRAHPRPGKAQRETRTRRPFCLQANEHRLLCVFSFSKTCRFWTEHHKSSALTVFNCQICPSHPVESKKNVGQTNNCSSYMPRNIELILAPLSYATFRLAYSDQVVLSRKEPWTCRGPNPYSQYNITALMGQLHFWKKCDFFLSPEKYRICQDGRRYYVLWCYRTQLRYKRRWIYHGYGRISHWRYSQVPTSLL